MSIIMRKLTEKSELKQLEELEAAVWSPASVIPLHMTLTLQKFGGLFLGAFDEGRMIGFLYSFPGFRDGQPHLCSHMLGFLPEYRKQGLGVQMKWLQRDEALLLGHTCITWTYDPLEAVNAYLNIAKLGGIVRHYLPNCYGNLEDDMNRGLPTDRFLVEWFLESKRVICKQTEPGVQAAYGEEAVPALSYACGGDGHPRVTAISSEFHAETLLVSVPSRFQDLKKADMSAAIAWREQTGTLFTKAFSAGYAVVDVLRSETEPVVHYMLSKSMAALEGVGEK
ncbi:GNAT family N-acetyltransferase [Brevibacillus migulae]|uniref:GNAT family N-acetyltransferase n=1 Tax=Brevibacillus migulae TaxID=1644114 RepID=UPI00106E8641|nr:GNAT family N-acetyltransferase [Brevibacillus migulae]